MKIIGTVENKEFKEAKNGNRYAILTIEGKKYNTFDMNLAGQASVGSKVEIEVETKGKFETLKSIRIVELPKSELPSFSLDEQFHYSLENLRYKSIQLILKYNEIFDLKPSYEEIIDKSEYILDYLKNGKNKTN